MAQLEGIPEQLRGLTARDPTDDAEEPAAANDEAVDEASAADTASDAVGTDEALTIDIVVEAAEDAAGTGEALTVDAASDAAGTDEALTIDIVVDAAEEAAGTEEALTVDAARDAAVTDETSAVNVASDAAVTDETSAVDVASDAAVTDEASAVGAASDTVSDEALAATAVTDEALTVDAASDAAVTEEASAVDAASDTVSDEALAATALSDAPVLDEASAVDATAGADPLPRVHTAESGGDDIEALLEQDEGAYGYLARATLLGANAWRAVELGAGARDAAIALARALPGLYLTAIDGFRPATRARRKPGKGSANVVFAVGDVRATGLPTHACDLVISNGVAHRLADPLALFVEVARLAREDAAICIRDLRRPDSTAELAALVELHLEDASEGQRRRFVGALQSALRVDEVEALCAAAGLTGVQVRRCTDRHWEVARARVRR